MKTSRLLCENLCLIGSLHVAALMAPPTHRLITSTFVSASLRTAPPTALINTLLRERGGCASFCRGVQAISLFVETAWAHFSLVECRAAFLHVVVPQKKQNRDNIQILNPHSCFCLSECILIVFKSSYWVFPITPEHPEVNMYLKKTDVVISKQCFYLTVYSYYQFNYYYCIYCVSLNFFLNI